MAYIIKRLRIVFGAAHPKPAAPATAEDAVSERIRKLVESLAEQQAMPDDWWKSELAAILSLRPGAAK